MVTATPPPELLACPWCPEGVSLTSNGDENHYVECHGCGAAGPAQDTPEEAITAWNTRTTHKPELPESVVTELPDPGLYEGTRLLPYETRYFKTAGIRESLNYTDNPKGYYTADQMRAYAAESVRAANARAEGWLPIESAPKSVADGSRVEGIYLLGFIPDDSLVDLSAGIDVIWWEPLLPNNKGTRGKWCANRFGDVCEVLPTHWQPLPAPPAAQAVRSEASEGDKS